MKGNGIGRFFKFSHKENGVPNYLKKDGVTEVEIECYIDQVWDSMSIYAKAAYVHMHEVSTGTSEYLECDEPDKLLTKKGREYVKELHKQLRRDEK